MRADQLTFLIVLLNAGAVFRLAILVTQDKILERPRNWLNTNFHGSLVTLVNCPWCISIWFGGFAVLFTVLWWWLWAWVCVVLCCSAVAGFLAERS